MQLNYKILWVENEASWLNETIVFVQDTVEENGFNFKCLTKSTAREINDLLKAPEPFKEFDLILIDFQLDEGDRGNEIIEQIRTHNIYTEVLFYSQDREGILKAISENWLDGIYCSSRNRDDFEDKFEKVFLTTIKKVQQISSLRGLVLTETSYLDFKIEQILKTFFDKRTVEESDSLRDYIIKAILSSTKSSHNNAGKIESTIDYHELVDHRLFDADKKRRATGKIIEFLNKEELIEKETFLEEYKTDVIDKRNELAHCIELENNGVTCLRTQGGDINYDEDACKKIRMNLKKHYVNLDSIIESI